MAKWDDQLSGMQRDIYKALEGRFNEWGLGSLVPKIKEYIVQGYSGETITALLQDSAEYRARFKGNEDRKKKGLPVLSPADYLGMETQYKNLFRQYGLPKDMFDSNEDLTRYIAGDVSPNEMQDRLNLVRQAVRSDNPAIRDTYKKWYAAGLNEGDAMAAMLNPDKALPELERKARAAQFGGAATQQGLGLSQSRAEYLANMGADANGAQQGFGQVADIQRNAGTLASRYGMQYGGQEDAENAVFLNDAAATQRIRKLGEREAAEFGGRGVGDSRSLGRGSY